MQVTCLFCTLDFVYIFWYNHYREKGGFSIPIVYDKLFQLLKDNGYTTYKIRQDKLIGQATLSALKNGTGGLDHKTIAKLCEKFDCQPGDLMEYIKAAE